MVYCCLFIPCKGLRTQGAFVSPKCIVMSY
jgi:hypothetical protein